MKLYLSLLAILLATPLLAQTATDATNGEGNARDATDTSELSMRSGTVFYSDDGMITLRTAAEAKVRWSELSAENQEALRAECNNIPTEGANTAENSVPADTSSEPSLPESEGANTTTEPMPASTDFISDSLRMKAVCEMIGSF